jgi:nucleotide-binding universal stress UspA family protein
MNKRILVVEDQPDNRQTAAQSLGCDLLIKGAYTQSRLRQMIFGGATRHVLENADIPILLAT